MLQVQNWNNVANFNLCWYWIHCYFTLKKLWPDLIEPILTVLLSPKIDGLGYLCSPNISETTLYSFSVDQVQNHTLQSNVCMHSEELDIVLIHWMLSYLTLAQSDHIRCFQIYYSVTEIATLFMRNTIHIVTVLIKLILQHSN